MQESFAVLSLSMSVWFFLFFLLALFRRFEAIILTRLRRDFPTLRKEPEDVGWELWLYPVLGVAFGFVYYFWH